MAVSVFFKPISITFAVIVFIESIIWTTCSLLLILWSLGVIEYNESSNYGFNTFVQNLYDLYLANPSFEQNERIINQYVFHILMWIYFIISLFLLFTSGVHISVLMQKSGTRKINFSSVIWLTLLYFLCLYDIVTCVLFGYDYSLVENIINGDSTMKEMKLSVILAFTIISAKGFILWIVNFVFTIIITILFSHKVYENDEPITEREVDAKNFSAYNAYGDTTMDENNTEVNNKLDTLRSKRSINNSVRSEPNSAINRSINYSVRSEPNSAINRSTWFTNVPFENPNQQSIQSIDLLDDILSQATSNRVHRDSSIRQPRSLATSLNPSPDPVIPKENSWFSRNSAPPDMTEKAHEGYSSGYRSEDEYDDDDDDDDEDDISESMSKMSVVYPKPRRFNLDEPPPDYDLK